MTATTGGFRVSNDGPQTKQTYIQVMTAYSSVTIDDGRPDRDVRPFQLVLAYASAARKGSDRGAHAALRHHAQHIHQRAYRAEVLQPHYRVNHLLGTALR
jgi:hypothetical protein